ncbi:molybdopterin molybdotransferase MoeA [Actinorugispora endophytica]|uniref:Molybdopterin molybdenumtransferase n=1 Tax=Actinorugispora endophytica TaxID=1605990 RepID=A0A4R6UW73_9ACTN|nr:molybdopterin molybdotransferase MoeA [Actinorugispora endophytica]TDQ51638.1 molybdopterin molybdotransferase [Actinorugispora endophytica]
MRVHGDIDRSGGTTQDGRPPLSWAEARAAARDIGRRCGPGARLREPLAAAAGGVLAEDLRARVAAPSYDAAAMDGYAVAGRGPWTVRGRVLAGRPHEIELAPGQAVEIATGARVPEGAGSVLPYEWAERDGDVLRGAVEPGRHVRRKGEETAAGSRVLPAGTVVTPAVLGLAASLAHDDLPVHRPRVRAVVSGDELISAGVPAPGAVRDAIGPMLAGLVASGGGVLAGARNVRDGFETMVSALADAADASVVVVCGASSAGPADHLRGALAELGASVLVDGVRCRPGHPQLLAFLGTEQEPGPVVVGLPGNPNAALVAVLTLLLPLLRGMTGRPDRDPGRLVEGLLTGHVSAHERDTRLVAVRVEGDRVVPVGHDRPAALRGAALADALAVLPPGWRGPEAELLWLPG